MKFAFHVEVETKNNELTESIGRDNIASILNDHLNDALMTNQFPWVIEVFSMETEVKG